MTAPDVGQLVGQLFRHRAGQILSCLTRIFGLENLELVEDAVQDALLKALHLWPYHGVPENPGAWIIQVAKNRALDIVRRRGTWRGKEDEIHRLILQMPEGDPDSDTVFAGEIRDDQLRMTFACCHPGIPIDSQVALTLKTVGGFSAVELARAFLTTKITMAQRLVRAKSRLRSTQTRLEVPTGEELPPRLDAVLAVLYLMFNEGYSASEGEALVRRDLCVEAIRLCELVCEHPAVSSPKAHALAALMQFQACRLPARADAAGDLLLLSEQDRSLWDHSMVAGAVRHLEMAAGGTEMSPYHLEAEIASCHVLIESYERTDWPRILECYDALVHLNPSPVVALNRVVAVWKVRGPETALRELEGIENNPALAGYYPTFATRAEILGQLGRDQEAVRCFQRAMELTGSVPVQRFLQRRMEKLPASSTR